MPDPATAFASAIESATQVANTPFFTTIIDRITGFKISQWSAEGEVRKKIIHDEYEKAKENGIVGIQYITSLRGVTNLVDTAVKSTKYIEPDKGNEIEIENDFFWNTIEHSKTISNDEMQELIAKIIAGEFNKPGTYSMSTLHTLKMLGKTELDLFERIGSLLINGRMIPQILFSLPKSALEFFNTLKIDFESLQILQSLGLVLPNEMTQTFDNPENKKYAIKYFDKIIFYKPTTVPASEMQLPGFYSLSMTGKQIIQHLKPSYIDQYFEWLKNNFKIANYIIENNT